MKKTLLTLTALCFVSACATDPYTGEDKVAKTAYGTGIGAAVGAGVGALVGGSRGALIGAGIGGATGAAVGGYMDVQARELRQQLAGTGVQVKEVGNQVILIMPGNVTFDTDKAVIKTTFKPVLDSVAKVINKYDKTLVQVVGHTDSTGTMQHNMELSNQRAKIVSTHLQLRQVAPGRITAYGVGPNQPIADNASEQGREQNRRVEITLINKQ